MKKFIYYEIVGFQSSSFVCYQLGNNLRYLNRNTAIKILEDILNKWGTEASFPSSDDLVSDVIIDDFPHLYCHQFAFKGCYGQIIVREIKIVERKIIYIE